MAKTLYFKWLSSININEISNGIENNSYLNIVNVNTFNSLDQLVKAVKNVESFNNIKVSVGEEYNITLNGITAPIQLTSRLKPYGGDNSYEIIDEGPSLEQLLKYKEELSNPNPSRVFYINDTVIGFSSLPNKMSTITVSILNTQYINTYADMSKYYFIEGLNVPFKVFLKSYGYTDKTIYEDIIRILVTFQAAKKLDFIDAEQIAASFNDERLVVDLMLKGVFEDIEKYCFK